MDSKKWFLPVPDKFQWLAKILYFGIIISLIAGIIGYGLTYNPIFIKIGVVAFFIFAIPLVIGIIINLVDILFFEIPKKDRAELAERKTIIRAYFEQQKKIIYLLMANVGKPISNVSGTISGEMQTFHLMLLPLLDHNRFGPMVSAFAEAHISFTMYVEAEILPTPKNKIAISS